MTNNKDDFDITQQLQDVSSQINQPNKFAKIFCEAAKSQVIIGETINKKILSLLKDNIDTDKLIKEKIKKVNEEDWKIFGRKIGLKLSSLISFIFGAVVIKLIDKWL